MAPPPAVGEQVGPFSDVELDRYPRHIVMREIGGVGQKPAGETAETFGANRVALVGHGRGTDLIAIEGLGELADALQQTQVGLEVWGVGNDEGVDEVGQLCKSKKEVAKKIQRFTGMIPRPDLSCSILPVTSQILRFQVEIVPNFEWHGRWHGGMEQFWLWVEDAQSGRM